MFRVPGSGFLAPDFGERKMTFCDFYIVEKANPYTQNHI